MVHLQSKKRVTAQEIADRFQLSLRTVYRDIKALDEAGVPIIGEAGVGYSVMEGYRLPPILFTKDEAASLLLGAKLVERFTDMSAQKSFESAMFKVKAVLRGADKEFLEELDSRMIVGKNPASAETENAELRMEQLRQCLVEKKVIRISYAGAYDRSISDRELEPIGILYYSLSWHLIAWCRLRNDYRDFRLDRIQKLQVLDQYFNAGKHPSLQEYMLTMKGDNEVQEAVVTFDLAVAKLIGREKYFHGYISEEEIGDKVRMKFLTGHPEYFCRWLLMFTGAISIETPSFVPELKRLTQELSALYNS